MSDIYKAAGIIVRNRMLLVERSKGKDFFISPGGSIEKGETAEIACLRELKEEFDIDVNQNDLEYFGEFSAPAAGQEHRIVYMKAFIVKEFTGEPIPTSEVDELAWISSKNKGGLLLGSIYEHQIIPKLVKQNIID